MRTASSIVLAGVLVIAVNNVHAAYTFVSLVDDTGPFLSFGAPSINADGQVAFRADLDAPGFSGIYAATDILGQPPVVTTVADNNASSFQGFSFQTPAISATATVTFVANRTGAAGGGTGLFAGNGGAITTLATPASGVGITSFGRPSVNASGEFAFRASHVEVPAGQILTGVFFGLSPLASSSGTFQNFGNGNAEISLNNSGTVAFNGMMDAGASGIYTVADGVLGFATVADTGGAFSSFTHSSPAINAAGTVAFYAQLDAGGEGIFQGPADGASAATTLADTSGPYASFSPVAAVNTAGTVAFAARLDGAAPGNGLFTGPDPVLHKVIKGGEPLFGSLAAEHIISNAAINDAGQIAFLYTLADGRRGIAIATPLFSPGDYNGDGSVDAADYVVWRNNDGSQQAYDIWRANFGASIGSGAGTASFAGTAVPEPTTAGLWVMGMLVIYVGHPGRIKGDRHQKWTARCQEMTPVPFNSEEE